MPDNPVGNLEQVHATRSTDEERAVVEEMLPRVSSLIMRSLESADEGAGAMTEQARAQRQLDWVARVRNEFLMPLEEAAIRERNTAIQRAMKAGIPASALTESTGLTLARVYQIRDGRR